MNIDNAKVTEGFVKYRLAHSAWGSFIVVDAIFTPNPSTRVGWDFHLPIFYGAPRLTFGVPSGDESSTFDMLHMSANVGAPRNKEAVAINLEIRSTGRVKSYRDGSQLSACVIQHEAPLHPNRSGAARRAGDDFEVRLYHHTLRKTVPLIEKSGHFRASRWNFQGTRELANVHYVYFTTLDRIRDEADLQRIAMASEGMIVQRGMADRLGASDPVVEMRVYRSSTRDRQATMRRWVPVGSMAPNHLLKFSPVNEMAYYEAILPEVVRLGVVPDATIAIDGSRVVPSEADEKTFEYVICGNAAAQAGLAAPYDEESTDQILHLENLQAEDVFEYWKRNMNTDQFTQRRPEFRSVLPPA